MSRLTIVTCRRGQSLFAWYAGQGLLTRIEVRVVGVVACSDLDWVDLNCRMLLVVVMTGSCGGARVKVVVGEAIDAVGCLDPISELIEQPSEEVF